LVAQHTGTNSIPEAAETVLHADAGICTIDHPSLSISSNGACIYVAYSVQFQNDTLNGFNKCHIFCSFASTNTMSFYIPIQVTNSGPGSYDERYASIAQTTPDLGGQMNNTVFLVYQKDPQPGSSAFNDGARMSRASLIFRKLYGFTCLPLPGIHEIGGEVPKTFSLHQNYPNPFNPSTLIKFDLPLESMTKITVYDVNGRVVEILVNENLLAGRYEVDFDASNLASGVYFCKIQAEEFTSVKKMVLMK
jgi:hypothetical protein